MADLRKQLQGYVRELKASAAVEKAHAEELFAERSRGSQGAGLVAEKGALVEQRVAERLERLLAEDRPDGA